MSTYWFLDINAPLRIEDTVAREHFRAALNTVSHRLDDGKMHFSPLVTNGLPFRPSGARELEANLPPEGWTIAEGRLHARLFVENLNRALDEDEKTRTHDALLDCLSSILDAPPGTIVGALASENSDCKGPLLRVGETIRWFPSPAMYPGAGYDMGPDMATIDRIPTDLVMDERDGLLCKIDLAALVARTPAA